MAQRRADVADAVRSFAFEFAFLLPVASSLPLAYRPTLLYRVRVMQKYGIEIEQLSPHGQAAVRAAERLAARTIIYREHVPLAAVVPIEDLNKLDPRDPGEGGSDPLLSLCGTCSNDVFVDMMNSDLSRTGLFHKS